MGNGNKSLTLLGHAKGRMIMKMETVFKAQFSAHCSRNPGPWHSVWINPDLQEASSPQTDKNRPLYQWVCVVCWHSEPMEEQSELI